MLRSDTAVLSRLSGRRLQLNLSSDLTVEVVHRSRIYWSIEKYRILENLLDS
jgi:hypothetical protein